MKRSLTVTLASWLLLAPAALANIPNIPESDRRDETRPQPEQPQPDSRSGELSNIRFSCERIDGQDTVMYSPKSRPGESYAWVTPSTMSSYWNNDRRCQEIARRLESYRPDGLLELANGVENGYDTVCVTTELDPTCRIVLTVPPEQDPQVTRDRTFQNIVVADSGTQTQPVTALTDNGLGGGGFGDLGDLGNLGGFGDLGLGGLETGNGDVGAIVSDILGGSQAGSTLRIVDSHDRIDLRPFLDPADGGTGEMLSSGNSLTDETDFAAPPQRNPNPNPNRLNPDGFR